MQEERAWIEISFFLMEFGVGVCMLAILAWLVLFRVNELKECWRVNGRTRYYLGLTVLATANNLALGTCGWAQAPVDTAG